MNLPRHFRGMTLVEVMVTITIIGVAGSALVATLGYLGSTGNTAMLQAQAQSVATAYLSEIRQRAFVDPDGLNAEPSRAQFDDVNDYDGLDDATATDAFGNPAGNFRVRVTVGPGALGGIPAADVRRIDVTVDYGAGAVVATGYRTRYP
jgi:MSHA pilin protein MshD